MNKSEKEEWIEDTLDSLDGLQRAQPSPDLWAAIERETQTPSPVVRPFLLGRLMAAAVILLVLLNGFVIQMILTSPTPSTPQQEGSLQQESLISDYQLYES